MGKTRKKTFKGDLGKLVDSSYEKTEEVRIEEKSSFSEETIRISIKGSKMMMDRLECCYLVFDRKKTEGCCV